MFPLLTDEQRQAVEQHGTPLPILDEQTGSFYMLLAVEFGPGTDQGNVVASIPTIQAYGEGGTKEEATLALSEALRGYLAEFS